jgi:hypothetical protein
MRRKTECAPVSPHLSAECRIWQEVYAKIWAKDLLRLFVNHISGGQFENH